MPSCLIVKNKAHHEVAPYSWTGGNPQPSAARSNTPQPEEPAIDRHKLEQLERKAKEAFEIGRQQGEAAARAKYEEQIECMAQSIADMVSMRSDIHRKSEMELLELSVAIARRILRREVSVDADALRGIVTVALGKLQSAEIYVVRVHPQLHNAVRSLLGRLCPDRQIKLEPDPALPMGGMIFETAKGALDVSLETQLEEVERGLIDRLTGGNRP